MAHESCKHIRQSDVLIGPQASADSLLYKMSVCLDCGKYIDNIGDLISFQNLVSKELGYEWRWTEMYMPQDELETLKPDQTRIVCIK
jgi:hypothetical protein